MFPDTGPGGHQTSDPGSEFYNIDGSHGTRDHLGHYNGQREDGISHSGYRGCSEQISRGVNCDLICDRDHYDLISLVTVG